MAGYSGNFCGESHADMNLTQFEKDCIDEFDKDQTIAELKFNSERESLEKVAYTVFQDTARSMSGIYTGIAVANIDYFVNFYLICVF